MKKIFYILASAIVALGAVACDNQDFDNIAPEANGEGLTISAVVDDTKVVFDGMTAKSWEKNDFITIGGYKFDYVEGEHVFRCTTPGVEDLVGQTLGATANELNPAKGIKGSTFVSTEEKEIQNGVGFTFKLNSALVKYTTSETVTFKGASVNGELAASKGTDQYVAVAAGTADFSYWVDGVQCKALSNFTFEPGQIYNLGTLEAPVGLCYKGSWDNWTNLRGMFSEGDYYVAKNVVCPANTTFKFVIKSSNVMMGATSATTSLGTWNAFANNDIKIASAGTYNIYVSKKNGAWSVVKVGNTVPTLNKKYLYLMPNNDWKTAGAKFVAWCYGGTATDTNKNFTWAMWEGNNDYYYLDITGHKQFYIKRVDPNNTNTTWNQVGPVTIGDNSLIRITGWSAYNVTTLVP